MDCRVDTHSEVRRSAPERPRTVDRGRGDFVILFLTFFSQSHDLILDFHDLILILENRENKKDTGAAPAGGAGSVRRKHVGKPVGFLCTQSQRRMQQESLTQSDI